MVWLVVGVVGDWWLVGGWLVVELIGDAVGSSLIGLTQLVGGWLLVVWLFGRFVRSSVGTVVGG